LALIVATDPARLQGSVPTLGAPFAQAVLDLDDGRPDLALQALVALPDQPLVAWERARASYAMGDAKAAIPAIRRFIEVAGHAAIGERHSATFLAQCLVETNDLPGALRVMRSARADEPKLGSLLYANLLELSGELPEAEAVLKALLPDAPKLSAAYVALARVRVRGGHRQAAMQALEASLQACGSCAPGQCGFQPPDLDAHRMLATLYLEDGVERERALQLAATARSLVQQPQWSDLYLAALSARSEGHPDARQLVDRLVEVTPQGTVAADKVAALLAS
jgi:tetratricopeptide (TPR) repeat protein